MNTVLQRLYHEILESRLPSHYYVFFKIMKDNHLDSMFVLTMIYYDITIMI